MSVMRRRSKAGKGFVILVCVAAFISLFSFIVMKLWNAILPDVLHVATINFWQAMGILVLSKILFGGFGGWGHKKHEWKKRMQDKWQHMTPEERDRFKEALEKRFEGRFGRRWCVPDEKYERRKEETRNNEAGAGASAE